MMCRRFGIVGQKEEGLVVMRQPNPEGELKFIVMRGDESAQRAPNDNKFLLSRRMRLPNDHKTFFLKANNAKPEAHQRVLSS